MTGLLASLLALVAGLLAGVFLAFSVFVMRALDTLGPGPATAAMQAVNRVILTSAFMPLFWGGTALALVACTAPAWAARPGAWWLAGSGALIVVGMFGVTAAANVPLNEALVRTPPLDWADYLRRWSAWNHVRMAASLAAAALALVALRA